MQNVKEIKRASSLCVPDFSAGYYHFFHIFLSTLHISLQYGY